MIRQLPDFNMPIIHYITVSVTLPYGEARNAVLVNDASIGTDQLGKYLYVGRSMKNFENIRLLKFIGLFYRFNFHALTHFQQCLGDITFGR